MALDFTIRHAMRYWAYISVGIFRANGRRSPMSIAVVVVVAVLVFVVVDAADALFVVEGRVKGWDRKGGRTSFFWGGGGVGGGGVHILF